MTLSHHRGYRLALNSGSSAYVLILAWFRCRLQAVGVMNLMNRGQEQHLHENPGLFWHRLRLCPCVRLAGARCA